MDKVVRKLSRDPRARTDKAPFDFRSLGHCHSVERLPIPGHVDLAAQPCTPEMFSPRICDLPPRELKGLCNRGENFVKTAADEAFSHISEHVNASSSEQSIDLRRTSHLVGFPPVKKTHQPRCSNDSTDHCSSAVRLQICKKQGGSTKRVRLPAHGFPCSETCCG